MDRERWTGETGREKADRDRRIEGGGPRETDRVSSTKRRLTEENGQRETDTERWTKGDGLRETD